MLFGKTFLENDPLWFKDAIIYEIHIKAFYDSNGDGIGDFGGLLQKLDYLEQLGINTIWLLPFYPSPLKDDGYDIADYCNVHPDYGTLRDFQKFLKGAHERGIRVITELVLNHTSDQHPWFKRARYAKPGSKWRNFYVWNNTTEKYKDARIIFKDFETSNWAWDPIAKEYFWHRFYSHQPDLNFKNPQVHKELFKIVDFWFQMGVDGLRLDAVPYLYEKNGTNCENLPETHAFLKKLRSHVDEKFKNRMLLAEANQWPEDAIAYFGDADECHMVFHFPIMPRIFMALWMEDRFPIIDILEQTPVIPDNAQWALFLRNHDELTLEMVTDEERDYMYRVYAKDAKARINLGIRRRLSPLLGNNRRRIEFMNILLFSLPGTPIIYYGDEIGMGDNYYLGDRDGVRTPMQWSPDRNAGFPVSNPQKLYLPLITDPEYHYITLNVENQERNLSSLLWWTKRVISIRKKYKAFGRGDIEFLTTNNSKIIAFVRRYQDEIILVVMNMSRFSQAVEVDLSKYAGFLPEEIFSGNKFPLIKETPYVLTLGFNDYYWFLLRKDINVISVKDKQKLPEIRLQKNLKELMEGTYLDYLKNQILPDYLKKCRWFASKSKHIRNVEILEDIPLISNNNSFQLLILKIYYTEGPVENYLLPICYTSAEDIEKTENKPERMIAKLSIGGEEGFLYDAVYNKIFRNILLGLMVRKTYVRGIQARLKIRVTNGCKKLLNKNTGFINSEVIKTEQSNTSINYDNIFLFKLYRRLEIGKNPETEMLKFITEKTKFSNIPPIDGAIEYLLPEGESITLGLVQRVVQNERDAWNFTLDALGRYFDRILSKKPKKEDIPKPSYSLLNSSYQDIHPLIHECIGEFYFEMISLLGKRTGQLHLALASQPDDPDFSPEPFSKLYQQSVYQSMRSLVKKNMQMLKMDINNLSENLQYQAIELLTMEHEILNRLEKIAHNKITAMKIRIHGDYHLGQVLYTGKDFVIIDFEGEPARALGERRLKRSCFRDVAGMIRSFHYAAYNMFLKHESIRPEDLTILEPWIEPWYYAVSGTFLNAYLETVCNAPFIPKEKKSIEILLESFLLEKAVYELGYEINNRPDWIMIPVRGILGIIKNTV